MMALLFIDRSITAAIVLPFVSRILLAYRDRCSTRSTARLTPELVMRSGKWSAGKRGGHESH